MNRIGRARAWVATHAATLDVLVALLALFLGVGPSLTEQDRREFGLEVSIWSVALVLLASVALLVRRRFPVAVWGMTLVFGVAALLVHGGPSPAYAPVIFALYTLATLCPLRVTVAAALATALPPGAHAALASGSVADGLARGLAAWCLLAAAVGVAVRSQRAAVAEARERARQAEATREEEAQRRVAEERLRIARELHDVVAHHISVINVQAGVAGHLVRIDPSKAVEALAHVREASQIVLHEVPGLLGLLRGDEGLERAPAPGLAEAGALVEAARRSGLDVSWSTTGVPVVLSPGADLTAYRVLQEALTNATRHGLGRASVAFVYDEAGFTLEVLNERRRGAEVAAGERHGLVGMRERVTSVGGDLSVGPHGTSGWRVCLHIPADRTVFVEGL